MRHFDKTFWWDILIRHFDKTFWWDILMRRLNETFNYTFWWEILLRYFDETFWWQILMRHNDKTFWWDILMRHFDETFWWDILIRHMNCILRTLMTCNDLWWHLMIFDHLWYGDDVNGMALWHFWLSLVYFITVRPSLTFWVWRRRNAMGGRGGLKQWMTLDSVCWAAPGFAWVC